MYRKTGWLYWMWSGHLRLVQLPFSSQSILRLSVTVLNKIIHLHVVLSLRVQWGLCLSVFLSGAKHEVRAYRLKQHASCSHTQALAPARLSTHQYWTWPPSSPSSYIYSFLMTYDNALYNLWYTIDNFLLHMREGLMKLAAPLCCNKIVMST